MSNNNKNTNCWRREGVRESEMNAREKQKNNKSFSFQHLFQSSSFTSLYHFRLSSSLLCFSLCFFVAVVCATHTQKKGKTKLFFWLGELLWRPITFMPIRLARRNKNEAKKFCVLMTRDYELTQCFFLLPSSVLYSIYIS